MGGIETNYSIHDIVTFKIVDQTGFFDRLLSNVYVQYKNFETEEISNPDFIVYLGNFSPSNQDCYILDDRYYIKKDYFYCRDTRKLAKWEFEMNGFEGGRMTARIHTNLSGNLSISGNIIDFLIDFKLNEKGFPLIHASCVSKNNKAFIFSARSGGGKSTIATYFLERGFNYLGDNYIILGKDWVLSFITPINIFTYNITPLIRNSLNRKDKILLLFKSYLHKLSGGYIKIFTKLDVSRLFPNKIIDKSKLDTIFLIIPRKEFRIEEINKEDLSEHLVINQQLEFFHLPFLNYLSAYSYMFPDSKFSTRWESYKENIESNLGNAILYKVEVPKKYDESVIDMLFSMVGKGED